MASSCNDVVLSNDTSIDDLRNATILECRNVLAAYGLLYLSLILLAFIILIVLSYTQRRIRLLTNCCWSRPSVVIPLNMMNSMPHRFIYTIVFGSISSTIANILITNAFSFVPGIGSITTSDPYLRSILTIISYLMIVFLISLLYYPLFACINAPLLLLGHLLGFIYSILNTYFILSYYNSISGCSQGCAFKSPKTIAVNVLAEVPIHVFNIIIVIWYGTALVCHLPGFNKNILKRKTEYHHRSVRHLLKRRYTVTVSPCWSKVKYYLNILYPYNPSFKFPLRFLVTMIITIFIIYRLFVEFLSATISASIYLTTWRELILLSSEYLIQLNGTTNITVLGHNISDITEVIEGFAPVIADGFLGLAISLPLSVIVSTILCCVLLFTLFRSVNVNLQKLKRGEKPVQFQYQLHNLLLSSIKYPGYQVAFTVFAWIIYIGSLVILSIIVQIIYYLLRYFTTFGLSRLIPLLITLVWTQCFYWFQLYVCKLAFINKQTPEHCTITNRRVFHWFSYVLLFQNVFVGLFSALLRMFYSVIFGFVLLMKLDKVLLMKGFERFDSAHNSYVGFLCELWESIERKRQYSGQLEIYPTEETFHVHYKLINTNDDDMTEVRPRVSQKALNRWHLVYTLLRNEQLLNYRKF